MIKTILSIAIALFCSLNMAADDITIVPGETFTLDICMENEEPVCAWQATVILPEGIELVKHGTSYEVSLSERHTARYSLMVSPRKGKSNEYNILVYSVSLVPLEGNSGPVATLKLHASDDYQGASTIQVVNQSQSSLDAKSLKVADQKHTIIADASSIETVRAKDLKGKQVFNLSGEPVSKPASRFIYVVDGKKVLVK